MRRAPSLLARSLAKLEERLGPLADPVGATNRAGARGEVVSAAVADAFGRELRAAAVGAAVAAAGSEDAPASPEVRAAADAGARGFAARITPAGWRALRPHLPRLRDRLREELDSRRGGGADRS